MDPHPLPLSRSLPHASRATPWAGIAALLLSACAAATPPQAAPGGTTLRVMVKLSQPATEPGDVVRRVSQAAGVPVHYQSAASPLWHAVTLSCPPETDPCAQALQRLRQDSAIAAVEPGRTLAPHTPQP